jgi:hypothetical protein
MMAIDGIKVRAAGFSERDRNRAGCLLRAKKPGPDGTFTVTFQRFMRGRSRTILYCAPGGGHACIYRRFANSSAGIPISLAICRNRIGETSRP